MITGPRRLNPPGLANRPQPLAGQWHASRSPRSMDWAPLSAQRSGSTVTAAACAADFGACRPGTSLRRGHPVVAVPPRPGRHRHRSAASRRSMTLRQRVRHDRTCTWPRTPAATRDRRVCRRAPGGPPRPVHVDDQRPDLRSSSWHCWPSRTSPTSARRPSARQRQPCRLVQGRCNLPAAARAEVRIGGGGCEDGDHATSRCRSGRQHDFGIYNTEYRTVTDLTNSALLHRAIDESQRSGSDGPPNLAAGAPTVVVDPYDLLRCRATPPRPAHHPGDAVRLCAPIFGGWSANWPWRRRRSPPQLLPPTDPPSSTGCSRRAWKKGSVPTGRGSGDRAIPALGRIR